MGRGRSRRVMVAGLVVTAAAAAVTLLVGQGSRDTGPTEAHLRDLEASRLRALVDADAETLEELHAKEFSLVNPVGQVEARDAYLADVMSGSLDYLTFSVTSPIEVRVLGDAAVLRYASDLDVVVQGLGRLRHPARHTDVYERRDGRWQAVWSHATAIGPLPAPEAADG